GPHLFRSGQTRIHFPVVAYGTTGTAANLVGAGERLQAVNAHNDFALAHESGKGLLAGGPYRRTGDEQVLVTGTEEVLGLLKGSHRQARAASVALPASND